MSGDDITDVEMFCRSIYDDTTQLLERPLLHEEAEPVTDAVAPSVYADFATAHDNALVDLAEEYSAVLTAAQQRDHIGSYVRLKEPELKTLRRVQNRFDGVWRGDTDDGARPYSGLSDTVVSFVEEYADGF